ncbi:hypothetical protein AK812_SmicGene11340 [Symbiodinium microadriaticum]|uniref:Uncharacterized protein n=1 Tax=Symbiodinium microadriaticum TaxID=2951 RepID=A0A1Q9EDF6_SYMMI|nr:hypothetical protein AK812_SmicGene11340 [Symbiodinium microadriaticum]
MSRCDGSKPSSFLTTDVRLHGGYGNENVAMKRYRIVLLPSHREAEIHTRCCYDHARCLKPILGTMKLAAARAFKGGIHVMAFMRTCVAAFLLVQGRAAGRAAQGQAASVIAQDEPEITHKADSV